MKKTCLFLFRSTSITIILCLLLSIIGCTEKKTYNNSDEYIFGQDSQENFIRYQNQKYIAESENAYYFINTNNSFIYIIDKKSFILKPLCNKSNCLHDKETSLTQRKKCNAYLNTFFESLVYFDGNLYYQGFTEKKDKDGNICQSNEIYQLSLDGNKRTVIYSTSDYIIWNFKIHRGNIYFQASKLEPDGTSNGYHSAMYKKSLTEKDAPIEFIPFYEFENTIILDTRFFGNYCFVYGEFINGENESEKILLKYNINDGSYYNLSKKLLHNIDSMFTIYNNRIFFSIGSKIFMCDLNGENQREIIDCKDYLSEYEFFVPYSSDGNHLFISPSNTDGSSNKVIVLDDKFNVVVQDLPFAFSAYIGCDENVFIVTNYSDGAENTVQIIKKSDYSNQVIYKFE